MATKGDVSDLDTLSFGGNYMIPLVEGFSRTRKTGVVQSDVVGGLTRQRKKYFNQPYECSATFRLDTVFEQDYFSSFARLNEGKKFICYMSCDRPIIEPYVVQVTSDWESDYISMVDGSITLTLEVLSTVENDLDELLTGLYPVVGNDLYNWFNGYKEIVEAMPNV